MDADEKTRFEMERFKARTFEPVDSALDLPHIKISVDDLQQRKIPLTALYERDTGWHYWVAGRDGRLQPVAAIPVEALYFSTDPEHPDDFYFHFLNFTFRRASYEKVIYWSQCILADLHNLGASLAKLRFLFQHVPPQSHFARMAATELEYIFMVCRSLLDLLQEVVGELWPRIRFPDIPDKTTHLKTSFAKMVLSENSPMTAEQIAERHKMPLAFGKAYAESGEFLQWFREFRDNVAHRGKSIDVVFVMEDGFGVKTDQVPFSKMPIWSEVNLKPNEIGSLHSAACYIIGKTLMTFDRMAELLIESIRWPAPLAPNYVLYARGHFIHELSKLDQGINELPWYGDG
jgi:hypothetical protein